MASTSLLFRLLCVSFCVVHACVDMFMCVHVRVCEPGSHVEARDLYQVSSSMALCLMFEAGSLPHCFSWGSRPVSPRYWLVSASPGLGLQVCASAPSFNMLIGIEVNSSHLHSQHFKLIVNC